MLFRFHDDYTVVLRFSRETGLQKKRLTNWFDVHQMQMLLVQGGE